jgi:hypothetical protein
MGASDQRGDIDPSPWTRKNGESNNRNSESNLYKKIPVQLNVLSPTNDLHHRITNSSRIDILEEERWYD